MDDPFLGRETAISRVAVARREQIQVRLGLCVLIAAAFHTMTGIVPAIAWVCVYAAMQLGEHFAFRQVTATTPLSTAQRLALYAVLTASNVVFASFGILECLHGGVWGILCAGLLWSGAILNGAMVSGELRAALACAVAPPLLHFFLVPYFVIENGGTLSAAVVIVMGGLLNGLATISIWSGGRRLLETAARERETGRLALLDPETGLQNRYALQRRVDAMQSENPGWSVAVAAISLDRFSHLRGAIGHTLMLDLVRELAARVAKVRGNTPVARLSTGTLGVELLVPRMAEAHKAAARLQAALATPLVLGSNKVDVSVTVGLSDATDSSAGSPAAALSIIDRALIAIDQARTARKQVARFDSVLYGNPGSNLSLMSDMLRALENGQMSVVYQPQCSVRTGEIATAEALVRWSHPQRGLLRPDLFVQMAEETGHIGALTEWVLRRVLADQVKLREAGFDLCLSVNWSGNLIDDNDFTERALQLTGEAAGKLCFEITETAIIGNAQLARETLMRFREAGITISIDDYGAGLSSLAYLRTIPADELKVDKTFVLNMAANPVDAELVRAAVGLAHSLGLQVVAEGVESERALQLLHAMGCDFAQGYVIARPMPLKDFMAFLQTRLAADAPSLRAAG